MGNRPHKVCPHLLLFHLQPDLFLLLDLSGQGTDAQRHCQHRHKSQRITGNGEIKFKIRIGENIIHLNDRSNRCHDSVNIPFRETGNKQNCQYKQQRHMTVRIDK